VCEFVVCIGLPSGGVHCASYEAKDSTDALAQHGMNSYGKLLAVVEKGSSVPDAVVQHTQVSGVGDAIVGEIINMGWFG